MDDSATVEQLIARLSGKTEEAVAAIEALRKRGTLGADQADLAGPALVRLLADPDEYIRAEAADALGAIGYAPAGAPLAERLLADENATVRAAAAETLGDLGDVTAVPALLHALADGDRAVRGFAANALGLIGTPELAPTLWRCVEREPSAATRGELFGALYRLGSTGALAALLDLLAAADSDLATNLLNTVEDLIARRQPAGLASDAAGIDRALSALERRLALVASRAAAVRARLSSVGGGL